MNKQDCHSFSLSDPYGFFDGEEELLQEIAQKAPHALSYEDFVYVFDTPFGPAGTFDECQKYLPYAVHFLLEHENELSESDGDELAERLFKWGCRHRKIMEKGSDNYKLISSLIPVFLKKTLASLSFEVAPSGRTMLLGVDTLLFYLFDGQMRYLDDEVYHVFASTWPTLSAQTQHIIIMLVWKKYAYKYKGCPLYDFDFINNEKTFENAIFALKDTYPNSVPSDVEKLIQHACTNYQRYQSGQDGVLFDDDMDLISIVFGEPETVCHENLWYLEYDSPPQQKYSEPFTHSKETLLWYQNKINSTKIESEN